MKHRRYLFQQLFQVPGYRRHGGQVGREGDQPGHWLQQLVGRRRRKSA